MKKKSRELLENELFTDSKTFLDSYNKKAPANFLQATEKNLDDFKRTHRALFKNSEKWSILKHRKKLMDWLFLEKK